MRERNFQGIRWLFSVTWTTEVSRAIFSHFAKHFPRLVMMWSEPDRRQMQWHRSVTSDWDQQVPPYLSQHGIVRVWRWARETLLLRVSVIWAPSWFPVSKCCVQIMFILQTVSEGWGCGCQFPLTPCIFFSVHGGEYFYRIKFACRVESVVSSSSDPSAHREKQWQNWPGLVLTNWVFNGPALAQKAYTINKSV